MKPTQRGKLLSQRKRITGPGVAIPAGFRKPPQKKRRAVAELSEVPAEVAVDKSNAAEEPPSIPISEPEGQPSLEQDAKECATAEGKDSQPLPSSTLDAPSDVVRIEQDDSGPLPTTRAFKISLNAFTFINSLRSCDGR